MKGIQKKVTIIGVGENGHLAEVVLVRAVIITRLAVIKTQIMTSGVAIVNKRDTCLEINQKNEAPSRLRACIDTRILFPKLKILLILTILKMF